MFVLIELQSVKNRFRFSIPNTKKPWNFLSIVEVPEKTYATNKKAHGINREHFHFLA